MQAYKMASYNIFLKKIITIKDLILYKKNYETFCHTATLLIYNLKYLSFVTYCFTKRKIEHTV